VTLGQQNQKTAANNGKQSKAVESHKSLNPIGLIRKWPDLLALLDLGL
jgi:hypothetical protein